MITDGFQREKQINTEREKAIETEVEAAATTPPVWQQLIFAKTTYPAVVPPLGAAARPVAAAHLRHLGHKDVCDGHDDGHHQRDIQGVRLRGWEAGAGGSRVEKDCCVPVPVPPSSSSAAATTTSVLLKHP